MPKEKQVWKLGKKAEKPAAPKNKKRAPKVEPKKTQEVSDNG